MLKKPTCLDARLGALLLLSHAGSDAYWLWTACSKRLELTEAWQQPHGAAIDVADSRADCLPEDCGHALQPTKKMFSIKQQPCLQQHVHRLESSLQSQVDILAQATTSMTAWQLTKRLRSSRRSTLTIARCPGWVLGMQSSLSQKGLCHSTRPQLSQ